MSALSPFCQGIPASSSINCFVYPQRLRRLSIHPRRLIPGERFHSIHFSRPLSDVKQSRGVNSSFIRTLWNLWRRKSELEWQPLHWPLTKAEILSQIGLIMFGLKDVWGFIFRPALPGFSGNISNKSLSLFQVAKVSSCLNKVTNQSSTQGCRPCPASAMMQY